MSDASCDDGRDELFLSLDRLMLLYLVTTFSFALTGMLIYIYYLRKGQFEDFEDVKYQMFRDEEED